MRNCGGHGEGCGGRHEHHGEGGGRGRMRQGPMGGFGLGVRGPGFQMRQGPMGGFGMRPGRMRAQRGDVKAAILSLVKEAPRHGYEIISEIEQRSNGAWKPSPGSIYPTLQALEDQGLVVGSDSEGKRVYSITEAGDEYLKNLPGGGVRWEQFQDGPLGGVMDLREQMFQLGAAVMQVAAQSDRDQTEAVAKLLTETKKKIYRLLAGDEL